jgi:hypothetical protein
MSNLSAKTPEGKARWRLDFNHPTLNISGYNLDNLGLGETFMAYRICAYNTPIALYDEQHEQWFVLSHAACRRMSATTAKYRKWVLKCLEGLKVVETESLPPL